MFYLGIDQHARQITISFRQEDGDIVMARQVSTQPEKIRNFLKNIQERSAADGGFVAILEVCGFNEWLLELLQEYGCQQTILIQPDKTSNKKTDRRDANQLCELLWVNRQRLHERKIPGVRRVYIVTGEALANRRLTAARQRAGRQRSRIICRVKHILRRHNLAWSCPTKTFETKKVQKWLRELKLHTVERLELHELLDVWSRCDQHIASLDQLITERVAQHEDAQLLMTVPGLAAYSALALSCRINDVSRFPRPRSLANYWGITPGCRNSGEVTQRLGSITKQGSPVARFLLGQLVLHVLRRDGKMRDWYKGIKRRRGAKIARVAVMRRLANAFWHMLTHRRPYRYAGPPREAHEQYQQWQHQQEISRQFEQMLRDRQAKLEVATAQEKVD